MKKVKITDICDLQVGKTPLRANSSYWGDGSMWLSIADMSQGIFLNKTKETITEIAISECNCKIVPSGTVLFSFKLSIGKVGITQVPMYTNEAIAAFIIKDKSILDTKFLLYALKSVDHSIGSNKAVMGKTLNKELLKKIEIILPSLNDQILIVKTLDRANNLLAKRKKAIELLDEYLKSVFWEMFGSLDKNTHDWKIATLSSVTKKVTDGTHQPPKFVEVGIPFIFISNIVNNEIKLKTKKFISDGTYKVLTKTTPIELGDILYTTVGSYGHPAIVKSNEKFCFQRHIAHIKPDTNKINTIFLYGMLKSPMVKHQADEKAKGIAQKTLNLSDLKNIKVFVPPVELQNKYAEITLQVEALKKKMVIQSEELEKQFQALMQKAFR